jgi:hypothetical protein
MKHFFLLWATVLGVSATAAAQSGCTDPKATNYAPTATVNDGSCTYAPTQYFLEKRATLPDLLNESSGLIHTDGNLWTFNDSGGEAAIYKISEQTGEILQTVTLTNATNVDWEAITADDTHLYIGDFGNNVSGNRRDLLIYKVRKADIGSSAQVSVTAREIRFTYSDQTDFSERSSNNTTFDCEAFIFRNNQLHLFTKDWVTFQTKHYTLPVTPGTHTAALQGSFDVNGLVTDAAIANIGYDTRDGSVFMWLLFGYSGTDFFGGHKRRIELGTALRYGQVEGITFAQGNTGYVSSETFERTMGGAAVQIPAGLYTFSTHEWIAQGPLSTENPLESPKTRLEVYPNPVQQGQDLHVRLTSNALPAHPQELHLVNAQGVSVGTYAIPRTDSTTLILPTLAFRTGAYFLHVADENRQRATKILVQ